MQKKDNKIGNKTAYKEERQIKGERLQEKKIEIDFKKKQKKKQVQSLACAHAQKTKNSVQRKSCLIAWG